MPLALLGIVLVVGGALVGSAPWSRSLLTVRGAPTTGLLFALSQSVAEKGVPGQRAALLDELRHRREFTQWQFRWYVRLCARLLTEEWCRADAIGALRSLREITQFPDGRIRSRTSNSEPDLPGTRWALVAARDDADCLIEPMIQILASSDLSDDDALIAATVLAFIGKQPDRCLPAIHSRLLRMEVDSYMVLMIDDLASFGEPSIPWYTDLFRHPNEMVRLVAANQAVQLARFRDRVAPALFDLLNDPAVAGTAAKTLRRIKVPPELIETLLEVGRTLRSVDQDRIVAIAAASGPSAKLMLEALQKRQDEYLRTMATRALERMTQGGPP